MVLGQESVQVSELFVVHRHRASVAIPGTYRKLLITRQLSTCLIVFRNAKSGAHCGRGAATMAAPARAVNHLLTMPA
jgi:hypothetical protein